jgi:origin recognition complex subunit 4
MRSQMINQALSAVQDSEPTTVIRLSAYAQNNDKLAMREIARQLARQTQQSSLFNEDDEDGDVEEEEELGEEFILVRNRLESLLRSF